EIWGPDRVGIRLSPITRTFGDTPLDSNPQSTYGYLAKRLGQLRLAYVHCIEGQTQGEKAANAFDFKALHAAFGGKYISNNGYDRQLAIKAIETGYADMVAFGRPFIGNPDLVERLRRNAALVEASHTAYYGGGAKGYTDYKALDETVAV